MLLAYLLICQLSTLVICNPFHKYPFVFLLDVGNEELEKTSSEQIRISVPGGSIALRYPAVGDGDTIAHVRVSGIDFGTDLKANIADGGPGFKYVVLVFYGNPGVPYDAVLTIQTLPDEMADEQTPENLDGDATKNNLSNDIPNVEAAQNDDEEYDDNGPEELQSVQSTNVKNSEIVQQQSTSNDYDRSENEVLDSDDYDEAQNKDADGAKDIHNLYRQILYERYNQNNVRDYNLDEAANQATLEETDSPKSQNKEASDEPKAEPYSVNNGFVNEEDFTGEDQIGVVDNNLYDKYKALKPHLYNNVRVYPQEAVHDAEIANSRSDLNTGEDPVEIDQMFNDEEIHNDADKFKDTNNNYFDSDDSSAVAY